MTRATYRFRAHAIAPDLGPEAEPITTAMKCKTCGETSEKAEETEIMNPATAQMASTVGDDVMTVHRLTDGKPACGAIGKVDE